MLSAFQQPFQRILSRNAQPVRTWSHARIGSDTYRAGLLLSRLRPLRSQLASRITIRTYAYGHRPLLYGSAMRATWLVIGLNSVVFCTWQYAIAKRDNRLLRRMQENFLLSWPNIQAGRYWTMLTSAFSHTNLVHFAFNMIALYAFGSIMAVVPGISAVHVLSLSIGSAAAGALAFLYHGKLSLPQPTGRIGSFSKSTRHISAAQGASGMVMGMAATATCLMPTAPMYVMLIPVAIPLWVVTGLYAALDLYYLDSGSRIGHAAHLGGAVYGMAYYFASLRRYGGVWQMVRRGLRK